VGQLFESFDEAWAYFLGRREPLEDFFAAFPPEEFEGEAWLIEPLPEVKAAAAELQRPLARFDWLKVVPSHFLHVTLPGAPGVVPAPTLEYRRVTCFHNAVAVEVDAPALKRLYPRKTFLPHLTLAVTTRPADPDELREVVRPLRETYVGGQKVTEVLHVAYPFSRERLFEPWSVRERVAV
jgi:2'-5' RNA ligase